jgi:hypothetical protein
MTNAQLGFLLANIWLARHAGPRYSMAMAFLLLISAFFAEWFK